MAVWGRFDFCHHSSFLCVSVPLWQLSLREYSLSTDGFRNNKGNCQKKSHTVEPCVSVPLWQLCGLIDIFLPNG
jgi:hypothetical protein